MKNTSKELVEKAYKESDLAKRWKCIAEIQRRGTREEFNIAKEQTKSNDPIRRGIGADILGQLGWQKSKFRKSSVQILVSLLEDKNEDVIYAAATALGHREAPEAIPHLIKLKDHKNEEIRLGVVYGLTGYEDEDTVKTLIELSNDPDHDVKNWATFNLGSQCDVDTPELRKVLKARLNDEDSDTRGEAIIGLAKRKYENIEDIIIKELENDEIGTLVLEAATLIGNRTFLPYLKKWQDFKKWQETPENLEDTYFQDVLYDAVKACS